MARVRPEQLGWGLTADMIITASGNSFAFDANGNVTLDFSNGNNTSFAITNGPNNLFSVDINGTVSIGNNVIVSGSILGNITASHLAEQGVATFQPIETPQYFITGGFYRSSSGDWYLS